MANFGDGARGRNDAIPVNQAQDGFQPASLTDANPPRPAGDVSNLDPTFTTRAELEALRPAVWGDLYTCTGCRDLEECRAAFGGGWEPDGTGCADWTPRRVTLAHLHLKD